MDEMSFQTHARRATVGRTLFFSGLLAAFGGVAPATAGPAIQVPPADEDLADRSLVIVYGEVAAIGPGPMVNGAPTTDAEYWVEEVLKGFVPASSLIVRLPVGPSPDGAAGTVALPAMLEEGDRALLFLRPEGRVWRAVDLGVGVFLEARVGGLTVLTRSRNPFPGPAGPGAPERPLRDGASFRRWIADRAAGLERPAEYFVPEAEAETIAHELSLDFLLGHSCVAGGCGRDVVEKALAPAELHAVRSVEKQEAPSCSHGAAVTLRNGYAVSMCWWHADAEGVASGEKLDGSSGVFWFFDRTNPEVLVKVLDGCSLNGHWWLYASGATDLGYQVEVTAPDGRTGLWENLPGQSLPSRDQEAFECLDG